MLLELNHGPLAVLTAAGRTVFRQATATHPAGIERHFGSALRLPELITIKGGLDRVIQLATGRSQA